MSEPIQGFTRPDIITLLLPELKATLHRNPELAREVFEELHPADAVDLIAALDSEEVTLLLQSLTPAETGRILAWAEPAAVDRYLDALPSSLVADILEKMDPDDRAELLDQFEDEEQAEILDHMEQEERRDAEQLLSHEDETAGRLMNPHVLTVPIDGSVEDVIEKARVGAREEWDVHSLYVVDAGGRLKGRVTLVKSLAADPGTPITRIMNPDPPVVTVETDQEQVASLIGKYDLLAIPVIETDGRLAGIVTVDDVVDVLIEEGTEDAQRMGGVQPLDDSYFETGFWTMFRKRGLWLTILFLVSILTGMILEQSEAVLAQALSLVTFLPLIIASGGNSGAQSATLVTRALAVGEVRVTDALRVAGREMSMGVALGLLLAVIGWATASVWQTGSAVAITVAVTLISVLVAGTLFGSMLPLLLKRMHVDPAIASSPFVASVVDITGILLYMSFARLILGI